MLKSYEKWNICMTAAACLVIAILMVLIAFDCAISVLIIYAAAVLAVFFGLDRVEKKNYPQWRKLRWKPRWALVIALLVLFVVLDLILPDSKTGYITVCCAFALACLTGPLQTTYYALKYHMDDFGSVEELTAAFPELKEKLKSEII